MRTRSCGWSGRSCEKRRSSSRGRTTGGSRALLVYRRGEEQLSRRLHVPRAWCEPDRVSQLGASRAVRQGVAGRVADREDQADPRGQQRRLWLTQDPCRAAARARGPGWGKRVARLMKAAGIAGVRPRKRWKTAIRIPGITPATDLVERDFNPSGPNVLWVADITYLRTGEGWLYLAAVQDTYSRLIVGWSMATHMRSSLVVDALKMALARRRPRPGLIHHSDQGGQYVSLAFGRAAREAGIAVSMGSRGDAYDNAVAETFFATLKKELVNRHSWPSRLELQSAVFEYIEAFSNRQRRHSTLNMLSPANYEQLRLSPLGG